MRNTNLLQKMMDLHTTNKSEDGDESKSRLLTVNIKRQMQRAFSKISKRKFRKK